MPAINNAVSLDALLSTLGPLAANDRLTGRVDARIGRRPHATAPRNVDRTANATWVALSASTQATDQRPMAIPVAVRRPAPRLGEHNGELLEVLGVDAAGRGRLEEASVP